MFHHDDQLHHRHVAALVAVTGAGRGASAAVDGKDAIDVVGLQTVEIADAAVHDGGYALSDFIRVIEPEDVPQLVDEHAADVIDVAAARDAQWAVVGPGNLPSAALDSTHEYLGERPHFGSGRRTVRWRASGGLMQRFGRPNLDVGKPVTGRLVHYAAAGMPCDSFIGCKA